MVLAIELGAPFLIFMPRRIRFVGAGLLLGLQVLIFVTGNYTFFNLLSAAITIFLFDDQALRGIGVDAAASSRVANDGASLERDVSAALRRRR